MRGRVHLSGTGSFLLGGGPAGVANSQRRLPAYPGSGLYLFRPRSQVKEVKVPIASPEDIITRPP